MLQVSYMEKYMKRILSTILILFFLVSSIGYASVHHYCQMMQTNVDMSEGDCCCSSEQTASADECHLPEVTESSDSCCSADTETQNPSSEPEEMISPLHSDCCETRSEFNHIDDSTITKIVDLKFFDTNVSTLVLAETSKRFEIRKLFVSVSDPSFHLNLPLLI